MKQSEKTEHTKNKIIAAATKEFGSCGYDASSINNICNNGDIAKGLIYHNFKDKDTLYLECVSLCFAEVTAYLEKQKTVGELEIYMSMRYRFFSEHPLYARIFFEAILQPPVKLKEEIAKRRLEFDLLNREIYRSALMKLNLRSNVSEDLALSHFELMQEMFNGYFSSSAYGGSSFSDKIAKHEEWLSQMLDIMLYGIAKEGVKK